MLLEWLQLVLIIAAAGALVGAAGGALANGLWLERLQTVAPRTRFVLLSALALLPAMVGVAAVAIAFSPSALDALGLVADHCAHHGGHAFHLCFVHSHPPPISGVVFGGGLVLSLWLVAGWSEELSRLRRARRWGQRLTDLSRFDADIDGWTFGSERALAVTVGLFDPKVCISETMSELLPSRQLQAVVAHEKAHARRFDSLVKFFVRLGAQLHLPAVRERLLTELDLACEQACDEAAAAAVGDPLAVAEAILAVERASAGRPAPAGVLGFGAGALERRVRAVIQADWRAPNWTAMAIIGATILSAIGASYNALHHTAETLLSFLF
jgi:Zn-dependent protease with chaperone function